MTDLVDSIPPDSELDTRLKFEDLDCGDVFRFTADEEYSFADPGNKSLYMKLTGNVFREFTTVDGNLSFSKAKLKVDDHDFADKKTVIKVVELLFKPVVWKQYR